MAQEDATGAEPQAAPAAPEWHAAAKAAGWTEPEGWHQVAKTAGWVAPGQMPEWAKSRIDALSGRLAAEKDAHSQTQRELAAEREVALALRREVAQTSGGNPTLPAGSVTPLSGGGSAGASSPAPQNFETAVEARARALLEQRQREEAEQASAARGREVYGDGFDDTVKRIGQIGEVPRELIDIAMQTGAAEHVFWKLGQDLDKAAKIARMQAGAMALEIAKLAEPPPPPPKVRASQAPDPVTPLASRGAVAPGELRDDLPPEEWLKRRDAQVAARRARR